MNHASLYSLHRDLIEWTRGNIAADLGERALAALGRDVAVPAAIAAQTDTRIARLTRLLWLGEVLSDEELVATLPVTTAHTNPTDLPFLEAAGGGWRSRWQVVPVDVPAHLQHAIRKASPDSAAARTNTVWIASTHGALQGARHAGDFVMGVGGASRTLAALAAYEPHQRVLDLGTGSGIHAIFAALSGANVTATDLSQPALELASFNAALNGVTLDLREGSLFEPVAGERFDVIVANPPFVITPPSARATVGNLDYRDGGLYGDQLCAHIVRGLGDRLRTKGRAWMLLNWEVPAGTDDPYAPLREWAKPGLDLHVIMREKLPVTAYIEMWLADGGVRPDHPDYEPSYRAWLADFDARGVSHVGLGYISAGQSQHATAATGPDEENLDSATQATSNSDAPFFLGQHLRGTPPSDLHAYTESIWLQRDLTPADLTALAPVATDVVEHRFYHPGESDPWIIKFTQTNGFGEEILATTALAGFVSVADGDLTTGQIIAALAELLSEDPATLTSQLLPKVVEMRRLGMLTFVDPHCE